MRWLYVRHCHRRSQQCSGVIVIFVVVVVIVGVGGVGCSCDESGGVIGIDIVVVVCVLMCVFFGVSSCYFLCWLIVGGFLLVEPVPKDQVLSCRTGKIRSRNGVLLTNKRCECIKREM